LTSAFGAIALDAVSACGASVADFAALAAEYYNDSREFSDTSSRRSGFFAL
jgi:hypothetical protein